MKTITTVSVSPEYLAAAKLKLGRGNLSKFVDECLKNVGQIEGNEDQEAKDIETELEKAIAKVSQLQIKQQQIAVARDITKRKAAEEASQNTLIWDSNLENEDENTDEQE